VLKREGGGTELGVWKKRGRRIQGRKVISRHLVNGIRCRKEEKKNEILEKQIKERKTRGSTQSVKKGKIVLNSFGVYLLRKGESLHTLILSLSGGLTFFEVALEGK